MMNWNEYFAGLMGNVSEFAKLAPETMRGLTYTARVFDAVSAFEKN